MGIAHHHTLHGSIITQVPPKLVAYLGITLKIKGSSEVFVISLVIFDDDFEAEKTALAIKEIRRQLRFPDDMEFKFFGLIAKSSWSFPVPRGFGRRA